MVRKAKQDSLGWAGISCTRQRSVTPADDYALASHPSFGLVGLQGRNKARSTAAIGWWRSPSWRWRCAASSWCRMASMWCVPRTAASRYVRPCSDLPCPAYGPPAVVLPDDLRDALCRELLDLVRDEYAHHGKSAVLPWRLELPAAVETDLLDHRSPFASEPFPQHPFLVSGRLLRQSIPTLGDHFAFLRRVVAQIPSPYRHFSWRLPAQGVQAEQFPHPVPLRFEKCVHHLPPV